MSDSRVEFTINGIKSNNPDVAVRDLVKRHEARKKAVTEFSGPMSKVSIFLDRWVQTNFKTEGGNVGGWLPFAVGGRRLKSGGIDSSAKLLQDTGRLRASFSPFATKDNAGIFSDLDYSEKHHKGIGVPERRLLPKKVEVQKDIKAIIKNEQTRKLKEIKGGR